MKRPSYKTLDHNFIPKKYNLFFETDFKSFKTYCEEELYGIVKTHTNILKLNYKELDIKKAFITCNKKVQTAELHLMPDKQIFELKTPKKIIGDIKIKIIFTIKNNEGAYGFYRSRYQYSKNEESILTTQFESTNARAAFPCIDEPESKATFDVSLRINKDLDAISNMPKKEEIIDKDKKLIMFETTPKMSTYLLYIGVGKFEVLTKRGGKPRISIITVPGKIKYAKVALNYAYKFLKFFESYFGIKYPLSKLDLIAIPDFAVGAMENWGAITFRETALLLDEAGGINQKRRIAEVIAHELAHQWFGDLVTMSWWNDLWLNESFATFMAFKAMEAVFPTWRVDLQYLLDVFNPAFVIDALHATHPISVYVKNEDEVSSMFDIISYEKGGSVLQMLEDYTGKEIFRNGLRLYLNTHAYENATKNDLWKAINESAQSTGKKLSVERMIEKWINNSGYPLIHISRSKDGFTLKQARFLFLGEMQGDWRVPIRYKTDKHNGLFLMEKKTSFLKENAKWIKLNFGQKSFYIVSYENRLLKGIIEAIKQRKLDERDLWGLENDLFLLTRCGKIRFDNYINFISILLTKSSYPTTNNLLNHLSFLYKLSKKPAAVNKIKMLGTIMAKKILKNLGWDDKINERDSDRLERNAAITFLGEVDEPKTTKKILKIFKKLLKGAAPKNKDLIQIAYKISAINGGANNLNKLITRYSVSKSQNERVFILAALGNFKNSALIKKALDFSASENVRLQDSDTVAISAAMNNKAHRVLFLWIKERWGEILKKSDPSTMFANKYIESLAFVHDKKLRDEIVKFFNLKENLRDDLKFSLAQTIERIDINLRYLNANR